MLIKINGSNEWTPVADFNSIRDLLDELPDNTGIFFTFGDKPYDTGLFTGNVVDVLSAVQKHLEVQDLRRETNQLQREVNQLVRDVNKPKINVGKIVRKPTTWFNGLSRRNKARIGLAGAGIALYGASFVVDHQIKNNQKAHADEVVANTPAGTTVNSNELILDQDDLKVLSYGLRVLGWASIAIAMLTYKT